MSEFNELYEILENQYKILDENYALEEEKFQVILKDDIDRLNEIVQLEQALYMKIRGNDMKRESSIKKLGLSDKTLSDIIDLMKEDDKIKFLEIQEELTNMMIKFRNKNKDCQELADIRLKRAQGMISKLEESSKNHIYNREQNEENKKKNVFSRKI